MLQKTELEPWVHGHSPEAFILGDFLPEDRGYSGKSNGGDFRFSL